MRDLGRLPHPGGRVLAVWNGRETGGKVAADGSYRLKVSLSGRHIELLNPLALDTAVRVQSTHVSRRVISPDCDSYGDRVIVVVRGNEQLAGLALRGAAGLAPRAHRARRSRARALAISWPPTSGQALHDCARRPLPAAGDRPRRARQHPRGRPRRDHGARRRARAAGPLDRRRPARAHRHLRRRARPAARARAAGRRRAADPGARHAGACRDRACPGRGARRRLRRLQPPCGTHVRDAAGGARRASGARRPARQRAARLRAAALPAAAGRPGHPLRRDHRSEISARACSTATRPSSCLPSAGAQTRSRAFSS